ncbi:hypothetical protein P4B35_01820 [Pontiellaceae bacterium B12227]|nr:hypothetical protein [Pontiellaceae bacterium B12227]
MKNRIVNILVGAVAFSVLPVAASPDVELKSPGGGHCMNVEPEKRVLIGQ